jgi:hypothetical protein
MASVDSINGGSAAGVSAQVASPPPANVNAELAKCESELSDWVHCPSSKTSAGKAKIAEITAKLDGLKAQMKRADEARSTASSQGQPHKPAALAAHRLRFDQIGASLDVQA